MDNIVTTVLGVIAAHPVTATLIAIFIVCIIAAIVIGYIMFDGLDGFVDMLGGLDGETTATSEE